MRCGIVLTLMSVSYALAGGVERPAPRWSSSTIRYASGSKSRRKYGPLPDPGPPCSTTAGLPRGFPQVSQ